MVDLDRSELLQTGSYVAGHWTHADDGATFAVTDPADGEVVAEVAELGSAGAERAVAAAHEAFASWRRTTAKERAAILRRWHGLMMAHQEDLARLMTAEQGKPLFESRGEIAYGASFIEWFAEEGKRAYGDVIPSHMNDRRLLVLKQPVGVATAITPWNFPTAMITRKAAPALAAGCTFVVKPAAQTPLSALAVALLAEEAGVPAGVFNVVTSEDSEGVGKVLTESPLVRKVSFTGSTAVGKILMRQSASTIKRVSLELGGNAPFIVFDDADVEAAVAGAITCKYRNAGQTCVCANRILVQDGVHDAFVERFAEAVRDMKVGKGIEEAVEIGPMIEPKAIEKVERLIADATGKGARLVVGGERHELGGLFFQPTVVADVSADMDFAHEEVFGPVAPIFRFSDEDEAIRLANDTQYGLASYFYARDIGRVMRVAEALEYGMVCVNDGILSTEVAPFGGVKESGLGREGSKYGLDEYLELKYLTLAGLDA